MQHLIFLVVGEFSTIDAEDIRAYLYHIGARVVEEFSPLVNVVIAGNDRHFSDQYDVDLAEKRGITVWHEADLLVRLNDDLLPIHSTTLAPYQPRIWFDLHQSYINMVLGKPVARFASARRKPRYFVPRVWLHEFEQFIVLPNMHNVTELVVQGAENTCWSSSNYLLQMPQLSYLLMLGLEQEQAGAVLQQMPQLIALAACQETHLRFSVIRHNGLQELHLQAGLDDSIYQCSLPNLQVLEVGGERAVNQVNDCLQRQHFPRLGHIGLFRQADWISTLQELYLPTNIVSLSLALQAGEQADDAFFATLGDQAYAKQLQHLHVSHVCVGRGGIDGEKFPVLTHLFIRDSHAYFLSFQQWNFAHPLNLFLEGVHLAEEDVAHLERAVAVGSFASLTLHLVAVENETVTQRLQALTIPVQLNNGGG